MANERIPKTVQRRAKGQAVLPGNIVDHADELAGGLLQRAEIRKRAYEMFCERHLVMGREEDDWLRAEAEVRA